MINKPEGKTIVDSMGSEFGYELIQAIPWAYWLYQRGELAGSISAIDTSPLYYFSPSHTEKYKIRCSGDYKQNNFPFNRIHSQKLDKSKWLPPPYKDHYKNDKFVYDKPLLIIANKYTMEWNSAPKNFLGPNILSLLLKYLTPKYQIVYNRTKHEADEANHPNKLKDKEMIRWDFPSTIFFEDLLKETGLSYNTLQMNLYANCNNFISVQGGFSVITSYFAKHNFIYAKAGGELKAGSYKNWYHEFGGSNIHHHKSYQELLDDVKQTL